MAVHCRPNRSTRHRYPASRLRSRKGLRCAGKLRLSIYGLRRWESTALNGSPVRFGVERIYSKGPMARLRVSPSDGKPDGGTHLTYELWPRREISSVSRDTSNQL